MKKISVSLLVLFLLTIVLGPGFIWAEDINTKFTESDGQESNVASESSGLVPLLNPTTAAPVVKAAWGMREGAVLLSGADYGVDEGAQFLPPGQHNVSKNISVCAVVSDLDGASNINSVYNEVYYPAVSFGTETQDDRTGCGARMGERCQMTQLSKENGYNLFCENIQNENANLPEFYGTNNFSGICGSEGELKQEKAAVYCCDRMLAYDDPAGDYKVYIFGQDKDGINSNILDGSFAYLELTAYETDFNSLDYGNVVLNAKKIIEGDMIWDEPKGENNATVSNVGNTRLQMNVAQDDMGLGKTEGEWNIRYGSKIGEEAVWQNYWPEETVLLDKVLDLSKSDRFDFSIEVLNFPKDNTANYGGKMSLNAQKAEDLICETVFMPDAASFALAPVVLATPTPEPTVSPEPTVTPEATITPTPTPEPTVAPEQTPTPTPEPAPEPTITPIPEPSPELTPTPESEA